MKELAEEFGAKLRVVKLDVDANPRVAAQMQVRAMPTLLVIKNGAVVGQLVGDQPKDKIKAMTLLGRLAVAQRKRARRAKATRRRPAIRRGEQKRTGQWRRSALR